MFRVILRLKAEKQYRKLPFAVQQKIIVGLQKLRNNPYQGKKLENELKGCYAIRVWPYRIIYFIDKEVIAVTVVTIGHRKDVYEKA